MSPIDDVVTSEEHVASRDVRSGFLSGPGFSDAPVRYSVVDGRAYFQGCIDMGPVAEVERHNEVVRARLAGLAEAQADLGSSDLVMAGVGLPPESTFLWDNGVVPFVIDSGLPNQQRVTQAIAHIEANTPIRFVARTNQADYIRFVTNGDAGFSSSPIGRRGGEQQIKISNGGTMGTTVHECLHSLGVLHEQSRCDRDQFVQINYANIQAGFESNFDKFCDGYDDYAEYDYDSIMHYPATAFGINGATTIVALRSGVTIGQRAGLSFGDRITVAQMYQRFFGTGHTGVWRSGNGVYGLWVNAPWASFQQKWQEWAGQGLRLVDIQVRRVGNEDRYSGVWLPGTGAYGLWVNASWASFQAKWQEWAGQGLRLVDLHVHRVGNEDRYSGVWLPGTAAYGLWVNASWASFQAKWQEWAGQGLRLVGMDVRRVGNEDRYSGVWLPGTAAYGLWVNATWASFVAKWQQWAGQGLRLVDISVNQNGGDTRYSGVFLAGTDGYYLWANVPWESFRARWQQLAAQGLRLVDYEFTVLATAADGADAGVPAVPAEEHDLVAGMGGFGGDPAAAPVPSAAAPALVAAGGDGDGGYAPGGAAPATAGADGLGAVVPAGDAGTDGAADGMGGTGVDSAPAATSAPEESDGAGGLVGAAASNGRSHR